MCWVKIVVIVCSKKRKEKEIIEIIPQYMVVENHEKPPHRPQAMPFKTSGNNRILILSGLKSLDFRPLFLFVLWYSYQQ